MAPSGEPTSAAQAALARFETENSSDGRLAHYARGRIKAFWLRQTLTALGSATIGVLHSPWLGLLLAALALAGEAIDILLLLRVLDLLGKGRPGQEAARIATLGATLQGSTIAACVVISWTTIPLREADFFAAAFLISATINAGLDRPLFRRAANLRLALFFSVGGGLLLLELAEDGFAVSRSYGFQAASVGLLSYISILFIQLLERNYAQRRRNEHALLTQQVAQEAGRAELARAVQDNQRLALVAKYANDSILISDPEERILWVNDAFTRITGYAFAEAVGKRPSDLLDAPGTDPATLARLAEARRGKTPVRVEILNNTKDGRLIWVETSIIPVFDDQGQHSAWIAVERDISQAKEREEELARARIAAEEAGQSKSRFLANMSHEIRTPMNGVIGVAELLSETQLNQIQAGYVETIIESGRALLGVINDILDLAKLQSGKAELELRPFSPLACAEGALRILRPAAAKKGVDLRLEAQSAPGFVLGDEGKLRQVILNLVGNAIKFTEVGAVTLRIGPVALAQDMVAIEVEDTGIGIAPDRLKVIFESFSQADAGIGRQFGGTGLGLTICAKLAEQMGGGIAVRSEPGRGSVFTFTARLPEAAAPAATAPSGERRREPRLRAGLRVMVAEDNRTNMMIVRKMLGAAVPALVEAQNGAEAVALYRERVPDVVLMDVSMPVKDGLQATREIRAHEAEAGLPPCPIIALTANVFEEDREVCLRAGMNGFLTKPLSRLELLAAIAEFCPEPSLAPRVIGL